jgi:hypothetical protein
MQTIYPRPAIAYRGTVTGLRISGVDGGATESGGAFIDNAGATIPTLADGNHLIEIYDSANRMIKGVLKAAGSGSGTLTAEKIPDWTNHISLGYTTFTKNADTRVIDSAIRNGTAIAYHEGMTMPGKALFYLTMALTLNGGKTDLPLFRTNTAVGLTDGVLTDVVLASGANAYYRTSNGSDTAIQLYSLGDASFSLTPSYKQVLTPSTSGATIVSQKGGVTYNFAFKDSNFSYNSASYYVLIKLLR